MEAERIDAWIAEVEALHQDEAATAQLLQPDLDSLMQAWTPEEEQQLKSSPLPDPNQASGHGARLRLGLRFCPPGAIDTATYARLVCNVVGLQPGARGGGLVEVLHTLFSLYLEFATNPAFRACQGQGLFE
eukprot:scaffold34.g4514.t1